jgi:hypothetical protein
LILIFGSCMLGRLFDSIYVHFWFNGVLYSFLKNLFCANSFFVKFLFVLYWQSFSAPDLQTFLIGLTKWLYQNFNWKFLGKWLPTKKDFSRLRLYIRLFSKILILGKNWKNYLFEIIFDLAAKKLNGFYFPTGWYNMSNFKYLVISTMALDSHHGFGCNRLSWWKCIQKGFDTQLKRTLMWLSRSKNKLITNHRLMNNIIELLSLKILKIRFHVARQINSIGAYKLVQ